MSELLEKLAADVMTFGVDLFEKMGPDKIMPTWIAQSHGGDDWDIAGTPWRNNMEKNIYIKVIKEHFAEIKAVRYALLAETWVITRKPNEEIELPPSECADKREVLMVTAEDYKEQIMISREIVRPVDGKPYLKEAETTHTKREDAGGRMSGLLPQAEGVALQ